MKLYSPLTLGSLELPNRIIMAPLTRCRSGADGVPNPLNVEHYAQRASLGLLVTEGTYPSKAGQGFPGQPGLATQEQIAGWRNVADAVHDAGGRVVAQVMHAGRVTHQDTNGGHQVVAPSAIAVEGQTRTYKGKQPFPIPHALTEEELPGIIDEFVQGSKNAIEAGLDGVELHGANGYLLHEFLSASTNVREDNYGGSPQNRARLVIEVVEAVAAAIGAERVGLRISPEHNVQSTLELDDIDVRETYGALIDAVAPLNLAYLSILFEQPSAPLVQDLRQRFRGPVMVNSGFKVITNREEAFAILDDGLADAVVVGRAAIANPDLARRWQEDLPLNTPDPSTFYTPGATGYTDYPAL
ncbi:alkene reductase [Arthrobacter roseus]|uniref:alkene reductase n=1 Tax=Arthrobacter roseus TaxID=136274 RepID=UPI0019630FD6|nr:alkene reductase [Arthrobacter roseus]MBM7847799.1 2,4-dienoyl-CoA reductase-like NADH-dependent reductase (Old Yellow Enzyme family) [Arthrobacter roseus]